MGLLILFGSLALMKAVGNSTSPQQAASKSLPAPKPLAGIKFPPLSKIDDDLGIDIDNLNTSGFGVVYCVYGSSETSITKLTKYVKLAIASATTFKSHSKGLKVAILTSNASFVKILDFKKVFDHIINN